MKAIISIETDTTWWKRIVDNPFLLTVRNISVIENQLFFLKSIGITEILILKEGKSSLEIENLLGQGEKWSLDISYSPLVEYSREDFNAYFSSFLKGEDFLFLKGLLFFNKQSKISLTDTNEVLENSKNEGIKLINSCKYFYDLNFSSSAKDDFSKFNFSKCSSYDRKGRNITIEEGSFVDEDSYISDHCILESGSLVIDSILSEACVVGSGGQIEKTIVLKNTVINNEINLKNMIVSDSMLYSRDLDELLILEDKSLIRDISDGFNTFKTDRIIASVFLILLSFTYPLLLLFRYLERSRIQRVFISTKKRHLIFTCCENKNLQKALNLFEMLVFIYKGKMEFVGITFEDRLLISKEEFDLLAMVSFYPKNSDLDVRRMHCDYYIAFRASLLRLSKIFSWKNWSLSYE